MRLLNLLFACVSIVLTTTLIAADMNSGSFMKIVDGEDGRSQLMVATKTYRSQKSDLRIILMGGFHMGEQALFSRHQDICEKASFVLLEGLAMDKLLEKNVDKEKLKLYFSVQQASIFAKAFDLQSHYFAFDFTRENFIHADKTFKATFGEQDANEFLDEGLASLPRCSSDSSSMNLSQKCDCYVDKSGNLTIAIYFGAGHMNILEQEMMLKTELAMKLESEEWIEVYSYVK